VTGGAGSTQRSIRNRDASVDQLDVACYLRREKPEHCDEARRIDESGNRGKHGVLGFHFAALEWISAM
jgi:hypothetical protein